MAGRGPNAIDISHALREDELRFREVCRLQRPRAICLRASEDHRDGWPCATLNRLLVPGPDLSTPRIACYRNDWRRQAPHPTRAPESYRRCFELLSRPA